MSFYVVRGYSADGKQFGVTVKCDLSETAAAYANDFLNRGCKSIDIDVIEGDADVEA